MCSEMDIETMGHVLHTNHTLFNTLSAGSTQLSLQDIPHSSETQCIPCKNRLLVSRCEATHCSSAKALQTLLEACAVSDGGDSRGYMDTISWSRADMVPKLCHKKGASSGKDSRFLLNSSSAFSLVAGFVRSRTSCSMLQQRYLFDQ